jgi:hypothetical protein
MHNLAAVESIGASIGSHRSVEVCTLLICRLFDRLWLWTSVIGDENDEMAIRPVHRQAFWLLAKGVFGLTSFENLSRGAHKLVVSRHFLFPSQDDRCDKQVCDGSSRKLQKRCTRIKIPRRVGRLLARIDRGGQFQGRGRLWSPKSKQGKLRPRPLDWGRPLRPTSGKPASCISGN